MKFKPGIPKRHLLLVAAGIWLFAGLFLLFRGIGSLEEADVRWWKSLLAVVGGIVFFLLVFVRISSKHITRITALEILKPCVFSFFDLKSYFIMLVMITLGVAVRKLHLISGEVISYFFITMAIPLLSSSVRFFAAWRNYFRMISRPEQDPSSV